MNPSIEELLKDVTRRIKSMMPMPPGHGFVLQVFQYEDKEFFYLSIVAAREVEKINQGLWEQLHPPNAES